CQAACGGTGSACMVGSECCSGTCSGGQCAATCSNVGQSCAGPNVCCSGLNCNPGTLLCENPCTPNTASCTSNAQCCSMFCGGAPNGRCGSSMCRPDNNPCMVDNDCCSSN